MKIAVSNIAWSPAEEPAIAQLLQDMNVRYVEIAPTKVWDDPLHVSDEQIKTYLNFWRSHNIEVVAFQSMLFPRPDLKIFEDEGLRTEALNYLHGFIALASKMHAGVLVFGSPKNRQRGEMPLEDANAIAKSFFDNLGSVATENKTSFCIEPNAPQYACDFVATAHDGVAIVQEVNNPGFRLHLDIACMALAGDPIAESIKSASDILQHFHISSPMLEQVEERDDVHHQEAADALRAINYDKYVSIEMRPGDEGTNLERVRTAVTLAQKYYE